MSVAQIAARDGDFERQPPHDLAAEQVVLGAMMLSKDAITDVVDTGLVPEDHYRGAHQIIHEAILEQYGAGDPADPVAVSDLLAQHGDLARAQGGAYLHTLIASVPVAANAAYYARIVKDRALLRKLIETGMRITQLGYAGDGDATELAARALAEMEAVAAPALTTNLRTFGELLQETLENLSDKAVRGLRLPWVDLDEVLLGLAPGTLTVIGARPAVGKSVSVGQIAAHAALSLGRRALLASVEMSAEEITARFVAAYAQVNLHSLLGRYTDERDWDKISAMYEKFSGAPLLIDDTPGATLAHIKGRLRAMARTQPAELLCVDYLQLLDAGKAESRERAVAELSWGLKTIAREFGIPVVVAAQLNRQSEMRSSKRPEMSDLRESGALEANADVVILLHREDAYDKDSPRAGEIDFIVAKNRQGVCTTVTAAFQGHYGRIADLAPPYQQEGGHP